MNERGHGRPFRRDRVVIGHDHLHGQTCGQFEGFPRGNSVINGDQKPHSIVIEPLHHGGIEAISLLHPRRNRWLRLSAQRSQRPQQQSCAGHPIGVVITTDGDTLTGSAGRHQTGTGLLEIGEMIAGRWQITRGEKSLGLGCGVESPAPQHTAKRQRQIKPSQWGWFHHGWKGPGPMERNSRQGNATGGDVPALCRCCCSR